jgi:hypothetical protein
MIRRRKKEKKRKEKETTSYMQMGAQNRKSKIIHV